MTPSINADRLWQSIMDIARIGATPEGGSCRWRFRSKTPKPVRCCSTGAVRSSCASSRMRSATCSCVAMAVTPPRRRSPLAAISTPCRPAGASTVYSACSPVWKRSRPGRRRHHHARAARTGELDQRGRQPFPSCDDGQPCARRRHDAGGCARHHRRQGRQRARGAARQRPGWRADTVAARLGLLAGGAYRTGANDGSHRRRYRYRHRHHACALFPAHHHRRAEPCRPNHDGPPARQLGRDGGDHPGGGTHRARRRARGTRFGDLDRELPQCARQVANITRLHCDVRHERAERAVAMEAGAAARTG